MNYGKLQLSFICLLVMSVIQFVTSFLVLHNILITLLSIIAILLCIGGLAYVNYKTK